MSTPNAIAFDRERACAYYTDTKTRIIQHQSLDPETGWPMGTPKSFVDLRATDSTPEHKPDGAIVDSEGCLWNAQWGSARVVRYSPDGRFMSELPLPTGHVTCPGFGGDGFRHLFVTSACEKLPENRPDWQENAGQVFAFETKFTGSAEPQVLSV